MVYIKLIQLSHTSEICCWISSSIVPKNNFNLENYRFDWFLLGKLWEVSVKTLQSDFSHSLVVFSLRDIYRYQPIPHSAVLLVYMLYTSCIASECYWLSSRWFTTLWSSVMSVDCTLLSAVESFGLSCEKIQTVFIFVRYGKIQHMSKV